MLPCSPTLLSPQIVAGIHAVSSHFSLEVSSALFVGTAYEQ